MKPPIKSKKGARGVTVTLTDDEYAVLQQMATRDCRSCSMQAKFLLTQALQKVIDNE